VNRVVMMTVLLVAVSCRRESEPSPSPRPTERPASRSQSVLLTATTPVGQGPAAVASHAGGAATDAGTSSGPSIRPVTAGKLVRLDGVGRESTWLEVRVPAQFKVTITKLTESRLPRAIIKGPHLRLEVLTPEVGFSPLSKQQKDLKESFPAVVFDHAEEFPNGNLIVYHAADPAGQAAKYYASVDRPSLDVTCASTPLESLQQAEQAIAICLSLHDRNDI
jgi:hypothetical protein